MIACFDFIVKSVFFDMWKVVLIRECEESLGKGLGEYCAYYRWQGPHKILREDIANLQEDLKGVFL